MNKKMWSLVIGLFIFTSLTIMSYPNIQNVRPKSLPSETANVLTIDDLDWKFGSFIRSATDILNQTYDDSFHYDLSDNMIHVQEISSFDCLVGAYALVPVTSEHLVFSFRAKARAEHEDAKNLFARLIDPETNDAIQNVPIVSYRKDGSLSTDFNQFGVNLTLPGYSEVYLMFYYYDAWSSDLNQEFWVADLNIYLSGEMPITPNLSPQEFDSFNWTVGAFYNDDFQNAYVPLKQKEGQQFTYSLNSSGLYIAETGDGCSDAFVGAYTILPVVYGQLKFSFEARVTADPGKLPFLIYRFYNSETYERIAGLPDITFWTDASATEVSDTGFVRIEFSISLRGYKNVTLLIGFNDDYLGNNNYQCWIKDFRVFTYDDFYDSDNYHFDDFIWQPGVYDPYDQTLNFLDLQGVEFAITSEGMHFIESEIGTFYPRYSSYTSVGAYAVVPVINGWLNFSFIGNAKSDYLEGGMIFIRIYDVCTFKWINSSTSDPAHIGGIWNDRILDCGQHLVNSTIPLQNYTEVILFLFYNDFWSANHYQEFWVSNFTIYKNDVALFVDNDEDGLSNAQELEIGTSFWYEDTDSDGLTDYEEVNVYYTDPKASDTDSDGLTDYEEVIVYNTNPTNPDTDGDGYTDGYEVNQATDPNDPDDYPMPTNETTSNSSTVNTSTLDMPLNITILVFAFATVAHLVKRKEYK